MYLEGALYVTVQSATGFFWISLNPQMCEKYFRRSCSLITGATSLSMSLSLAIGSAVSWLITPANWLFKPAEFHSCLKTGKAMYWCKSGLSGSSCVCNTCIQKDTADSTWTINRAQERKQNKMGVWLFKCKQSSNFSTRCYGIWSWKVPKIIYLQLWLQHAMGRLFHNLFITSVRWSKDAFHPTGNPSIKPNLGNRATDNNILLALCMWCMPY